MRLKQGIYCILRYKNKKEEYVPLDPQPNAEDVVKVHRPYHKLQVDTPDKTKFQRRITWIEKSESVLPEIPSALALVGYIGTYPGQGFHGNVKDKGTRHSYERNHK